MHLGNSIICPVTGIPMLAIAVGTAFYACTKLKEKNIDTLKVVTLTALVFALQMLNFAIPTTGSSDHIIGGVLLAAILGPYTAFLAMCAILIIQAVFFADGGLLALGCNIFNMGFLACFVAYPFIFRPFEQRNKPVLGAIIASVAALQLGSIAVAIEGALSGTIALSSLGTFTGLMQAIHLPIGIVEGIVTASILILSQKFESKKLSYSFGIISLVLAGFIAQYASTKPDGLEWSLLNISDAVTENTLGFLYNISTMIQTKTAILTDYSVLGLLAAGFIMYFICYLISHQTVKADV